MYLCVCGELCFVHIQFVKKTIGRERRVFVVDIAVDVLIMFRADLF